MRRLRFSVYYFMLAGLFLGCTRAPGESRFEVDGHLSGVDYSVQKGEKIISALLSGSLVIQKKTEDGYLLSLHIVRPADLDYEQDIQFSTDLTGTVLTVHKNNTLVARARSGSVTIEKLSLNDPPYVKGRFHAGFSSSSADILEGTFHVLIAKELSGL